ncbi:MAG TPA: hypothetical protein VGJ21_06710 [Terracidiphilus sp.]
MARIRKSELAFDAITLEGSLISPAKLAEVAVLKATEQKEADYHIPKGLTLHDETARYFRIGQALFRELFAGAHPSQQATIRFTQELLRDVFGFADIESVSGPKIQGDRTFIVHLEALKGRVPVVVVPPADDLDHASTHVSHDRRRSAASSLQDWLNTDENALWGLCSNGEHLRLLRDNQSLTRPAYLEANLRQIFENEDFAGFAVLWLIVHASRFGLAGISASDCALERWRESGSKEGLAARERLSVGVKEALLALGNGFLSHPANAELRDRVAGGQMPQFFNELLRLVYRVFSAELRICRNRLILGSAGATPLGSELPINFLNREGLGIEIAADPVAHFLMLFMVGIGEGVEEFIKPRDASTVVRRTRETSIDTDWAGHIRQERQQLLEDDGVLPVITEIVGVDELGAGPSEHTTEPNIAFVYLHPHTDVFRVGSPEVAFPGSKFVHVAVVPTHCCLQNIVQFGQGHRRWNKQAPPDRRSCAE